jgi:hypothetical protein
MGRIDEIRARLEAATPGPWRHYQNLGDTWTVCWESEDGKQGRAVGDIDEMQDASFIATAPEDVRYLLEELDKAQLAIRTLAGSLQSNLDYLNRHHPKIYGFLTRDREAAHEQD